MAPGSNLTFLAVRNGAAAGRSHMRISAAAGPLGGSAGKTKGLAMPGGLAIEMESFGVAKQNHGFLST